MTNESSTKYTWALEQAMKDGIKAVVDVLENWEHGDLASAVNGLEDWMSVACGVLGISCDSCDRIANRFVGKTAYCDKCFEDSASPEASQTDDRDANAATHNIDIAYARACHGTCADCGATPDECFDRPCAASQTE